MFLVLWGFEVKPGCEQRFERVYGPGVTGIPCFGAIPTMREVICSATLGNRAFTSLPTTGFRANRTKNFCRPGHRIQTLGRDRRRTDREGAARRLVRTIDETLNRATLTVSCLDGAQTFETLRKAQSVHHWLYLAPERYQTVCRNRVAECCGVPAARTRLRRQDSRCEPRLPSWQAIRWRSSPPLKTSLWMLVSCLGRQRSTPGSGENVAAASLMTVAFTRLASRAAGSAWRTSFRHRSMISCRGFCNRS